MHFSAVALTSLFASLVLATTKPPSGALVVGPAAKYKTVQAAVTAASSGATIFIEAGIYKEQVYIASDKTNLKIIGYSTDGSSYKANRVTITQGLAQDSNATMIGPNGAILPKLNNDGTGTLRAYGDGLKMYNVNLVNSRGKGSQALALSAWGNELGFYACQFIGFQDTIMSQKGKHFIGNSLIVGATDYLFGQYGVLWIEKSVLHCLNASTGYITANGRLDDTNPSYYVINNSKVTGVNNGTYTLGRPWRDYARVVFQHTKLSEVIKPAGWSVWTKDVTPPSTVTFGEYKNTGAGSSLNGRASFSKQLNEGVAIETLFSSTSWIDSAFL